MSDRELLELAAKAAGITGLDFDYHKREGHGLYFGPRLPYPPGLQAMCPRYWRPLEDDGDALRLAVGLGMTLRLNQFDEWTQVFMGDCFARMTPAVSENIGRARQEQTIEQATRRAIVRAAAEIGRDMP